MPQRMSIIFFLLKIALFYCFSDFNCYLCFGVYAMAFAKTRHQF